VSRNNAPKRLKKTSATDTEAAEKRPLRKTCSGIIGSSRRSSHAVNAASSATAPPRIAQRGDRGPPELGSLDQAVGQEHQTGERQDRADRVEPRRAVGTGGGNARATGEHVFHLNQNIEPA
jgi:hypothetical protein